MNLLNYKSYYNNIANIVIGTFLDQFASTNVQYTPATDVKVNGWGDGYTFFSDTNVAISSGLTLTLTDANCPSSMIVYLSTKKKKKVYHLVGSPHTVRYL